MNKLKWKKEFGSCEKVVSRAGMYMLPAMANNEKVQTITGNGLEILEELTSEYLKDLKGVGNDEN